ncbi:MAG: tetratricopeptide repeat protein [Bacillota bacterium]
MKKLLLILIVSFLALSGCGLLEDSISQEMINTGDEYFSKQMYEKAIEYYKKAIEADRENATAYNNIAAALTFMDRSEEALEYCEEALRIDPDMVMAYANKGLSQSNMGKYEEAIISFDEAISRDKHNDFAHYHKGDALLNLSRYEEALESYNSAIAGSDRNKEYLLGRAIALYYLESFREAELACDEAIKIDNRYDDAYLWKARILIELERYSDAVQSTVEVIDRNPVNADAYYVKGIAHMRSERYEEALTAINKATGLDNGFLDAFLTKLSLLYRMQSYKECIDAGMEALRIFPDDEDILWYIADSYTALYKYEESIDYYKKVLEVNPENSAVWTYLGWSYYFIQDYDNGMNAAKKAMILDKESKAAEELTKALEDTKLPEGQRIVSFVRSNYLYLDRVEDFEEKSKSFARKDNVTYMEIYDYLNSIRINEDYFSFFIYDEYYDELINEETEDQLSFVKWDNNTYYARIGMFNTSVGYDFKSEIKKIYNKDEKNLIIDLRDNTGGYTEASNQILDALLPECTVSTVTYRDGSKELYKSDASSFGFNRIIVLVNENSASSSELLALGLKDKLDNVYIVGQKTTGKGVGQYIFDNREKKYAIFLVSFYWSIEGKSVNGKGIIPDIVIKGHKDTDYFNEVSAIINS